MRDMYTLHLQPARNKALLSKMLWSAAWTASPVLAWSVAHADPVQPTIGPVIYNVTEANGGVMGATIDGGATAVGDDSTNNASVLQSFINYASTTTTLVNGVTVDGATVEIPASAKQYLTSELTIDSDVNLEVLSGATLQNIKPTSTLITTSGATSNVAITGGGILNDNATTTSSSNNMLALSNVTNLLVNDVSIESSSHEHLVPEFCNNVTINNVTISDQSIIGNSDGIDYSGSNFLIENCTISDDDDDIVAKPGSSTGTAVYTSNILIQNILITAGHGISIGGEDTGGLNNMTVNNVTFNGSTLAGIENGLRLKAGRANGGLAQNITYNDITMVNVGTPIQISSWYNGSTGGDQWPNSAGVANAAAASNAAVNTTTPFWKNVVFSNIKSTGSSATTVIYGLPEAPVQNVMFENDSLDTEMTINFAGYNGTFSPTLVPGLDVVMYNTSIAGTLLTSQSQLTNSSVFTQSPNGMYQADILISVPEPSSGFLLAGGLLLTMRRRRSNEDQSAAQSSTS
jgi:polygalacturonase